MIEIVDYGMDNLSTDTVILKGITLGDHCLVSANILVNKSYPANSIIADVPARKIGKIIVKDDDVQMKFFTEKS